MLGRAKEHSCITEARRAGKGGMLLPNCAVWNLIDNVSGLTQPSSLSLSAAPLHRLKIFRAFQFGSFPAVPKNLYSRFRSVNAKCQLTTYDYPVIKSIRHKGQKQFRDEGSRAGINADHAENLTLVLSAMQAADTLDDLRAPKPRLHPWKGKLKGRWPMSESGQWRVTFAFVKGEAIDVDYQQYH